MSESDWPAWTLGRRGAPGGLSADRAWRWCVLRTVREGRLARRRGRPVARHQLERLFARRWVWFENMMPFAEWQGWLELGRKQIILSKGWIDHGTGPK